MTHHFSCGVEAAKCYFGQKVVDENDYVLIPNAIDVARFIYNPKIRNKIRKENNLENKHVVGHPKFLLQMSLSHTARLTYVLLLDRMTLSQKNSWVDAQGRTYVLYPLAGLAEDLQSSISSVTRALRELEAARLIERRSNGFSKPNQIFLGVPRTAQKCAIEIAQNEQPDCSKVSNTVAQNCTPNQINKNNLRLNQLSRTKEAYGRYRNVYLEDYSELKMEIAELDSLIDDLSIYMQSTGRKYADHAATLRSWSARKKRQQKPGAGIPDYTYNKEESL